MSIEIKVLMPGTALPDRYVPLIGRDDILALTGTTPENGPLFLQYAIAILTKDGHGLAWGDLHDAEFRDCVSLFSRFCRIAYAAGRHSHLF